MANIGFGDSGNVTHVDVSATYGGDASNVEAGDLNSVTVKLYDGNGDLVASNSADYTTQPTEVSFTGTDAETGDQVASMEVTAEVSSSASDGDVFDAGVEVFDANTDTSFSGPTSPYDTAGTQEVVVSDTYVSAEVGTIGPTEDLSGVTVDFVDTTTNTVVATRTTDASGQTPRVQVGPGTYRADANTTGFEESSSTEEYIPEGQTLELDVTLTAQGNPKTIEVIDAVPGDQQAPADGSTPVTYFVQVRGQFGDQTDVPLNNFDVNANVEDGGTSVSLSPAQNGTQEVTLPDGTTVNGTTSFTVTDTEVEQANISFTVVQNQSVVTSAQPTFGALAGEGTVQGQVMAEDTTSGLPDARVHAVTYDRFDRNEFQTSRDVGDGDTDYARVVNATTGDTVSLDNYRIALTGDWNEDAIGQVEFLNTSNKGVGSGFFLKDKNAGASGSTVGFVVVPLEPGDYEVEYSENAQDASREASASGSGDFVTVASSSSFSASANLTYEYAEAQSNPYSEGGPVLAEETDEDGDYQLNKLYTDYQEGVQYVIVGQKTGYSTDFVDVYVTESGPDYGIEFYGGLGEDGDDENLNLEQRDITPVVDVTNVGSAQSIEAAQDGDIQMFSNQTDEYAQTIVRDGSTVDVVNVSTTAEQTGTPVDATVTLEVVDIDDGPNANDTSLIGEWQNNVISGTVVSVDNQNDTITIQTGSDGSAQVWYQADRSVETYTNVESGFIRATAENNAEEPDTTEKQFLGITQFGSISGIATDDNNNGIGDVEVYADEFALSTSFLGAGPKVTLEPASTPNPQNYTVSVVNATGDVVESHVVPRTELRQGYDFGEFNDSIRQTYGLIPPSAEGFTLVAQTREDGTYTLPRVPARGTSSQFQNIYNVRGVTELDNTGQAQAFPGVGSTDDANIVISGTQPTQFTVSNVQPDGVNVTAGDTITVTADVTNIGSASGSTTAEFGLDTNNNGELDDGEILATNTTDTLVSQETQPVSFTVDTTGVPAGTYTHIVSTEDDSQSASITIESSGNGGNGETSFQDVLVTIENYNNGDASFQDVLQTINDYNADN